MKRRLPFFLVVGLASSAVYASAQRFVAYVPTSEATVTGALLVSGDNSILGESSVVSSTERPAHVILSRGGSLLVCQTSAVHLLVGHGTPDKGGQSYDPILISLDKGSVELRMPMIATDSVVTSGMRFASAAHHNKPDLLDLAMRISANGDTCVENRGKKSPPLTITDALGQSSYVLKPEQHVVFAHGLIQEASSGATTSCGCPPAPPQGMSIADAALRAGAGNTATFASNASGFPFPTAASRGIESPAPLPETSSENRIKVTGTLLYEAPALTRAEELDAALAPHDDLAPPPSPSLAAPGRRKLVLLPAPPKPAVVASALRRPVEHESGPETDPKPKKSGGVGGFFKKIFGGG